MQGKAHIFFDLDDTLWDFKANSTRVLSLLYGEFGLESKLGVTFDTFLQSYMQINLSRWRAYSMSEITQEQLRHRRFHEAFLQFGYSNADESDRFSDRYIALAPHGKALKEGCIDTLEYLKPRFALHIITNGFRATQGVKLENCGLRGYFSQVIISDEHGFTKPQRQIFEVAEELAGAAPSECVMVGNDLEVDVLGAERAGWTAIHLSDGSERAYPGLSIRQLSELKQIF